MMGSMNEKPIRGEREPASKTLLCTGYGHANGSGGTCLHATVYGLMCEEYEAMRDRAQDCCELCRTPGSETPRGALVIDHFDGKGVRFVRGLLCDRCNALMARHDGTAPWGPSTEHRKDEARSYHLTAFDEPTDDEFERADAVIAERVRALAGRCAPRVRKPVTEDPEVEVMAFRLRMSLSPAQAFRLGVLLIQPLPDPVPHPKHD
jgi:hypothetical protein